MEAGCGDSCAPAKSGRPAEMAGETVRFDGFCRDQSLRTFMIICERRFVTIFRECFSEGSKIFYLMSCLIYGCGNRLLRVAKDGQGRVMKGPAFNVRAPTVHISQYKKPRLKGSSTAKTILCQ